MNSFSASSQPTFIASSLTALEECTEASVYAPGYIQPHGVLLALQETDLTILQASENVERFWGIPAAALLGQSLQHLFSRAQVEQIADILQQDYLERYNPFELRTRVKDSHPSPLTQGESSRQIGSPLSNGKGLGGGAQTFRSTLHRTAEALILELEPQPSAEKTPSNQFYHRLQAATLNLRGAIDLAALAQTLASEVKAITGFDRVMVYRFAADDHGVVLAEVKESHLESYLGLHYPAIDIPVPARQLFLRHWVRQIPDVNYTPARLLSHDALNDQPLDLSDCVLRGVSPYHVEYLQRMGVAGSLTISLIDDQRLWGLIACHHYSPRLVAYETRKTCEFLGQFASIELVHQQERELSRYRVQVRAIQDKLQQAFLREPNFIQQVLTRKATELLKLVHAEGVAIALDQTISLSGQTPPLEAVQDLLAWLPPLNQSDLYLTDCLARPYPPARAFKHVASGLLAISIVLHQKSYHLLWFRPEQIQTVNWAGDPHTAVLVDADGEQRLTPRKSFALWQETVRETSLPWQSPEIEAALMMRNTLMLAVLEFSQTALEEAAERAEIANRAKSQFLAQMSHELRTPLTAILGFTELMSCSQAIPMEFQEYLGIISQSGEHLLTLINGVLEMSKIEAGHLALDTSYFNLHRLLRSLQEMFMLKALQKGLVFSFEEDQSTPRYVCGDEAKLRQILINLISNAIKFTTQGSVTVQVGLAATEDVQQGCVCYPEAVALCGRRMLSIAVKDTGCGIESSDLELVFEAFMQTEQGRYAQGTGLGLSISRQLTRLMGGDITVQSTVNQGSTFTCQVLLHQPDTTAEPETAPLVIGLEPGHPTYRLLIVEADQNHRHRLQTLLQSIGFDVRAVETGEDAIAQWQQWQPQLILMDIQMPVMDGYATAKWIRGEERRRAGDASGDGEARDATVLSAAASSASLTPPSTPNPIHPTKIIALTACTLAADRAASLQTGCDDSVTKPFTETALFNVIARQLEVRYRYADQASSPPGIAEWRSLTRLDLHIMPVPWLAQMHEAALDLDDDTIHHLIAQIPPQEQTLIKGMTLLVNNFRLDAIASLTQPDGGNDADSTQTN